MRLETPTTACPVEKCAPLGLGPLEEQLDGTVSGELALSPSGTASGGTGSAAPPAPRRRTPTLSDILRAYGKTLMRVNPKYGVSFTFI